MDERNHLAGVAEEGLAVYENGVDLTLIRHQLQLSPLERLLALEQQVRALEELKTLVKRIPAP